MTELGAYLPQLLLAWSIQLTGIISPGPSVALILGIAIRQGRGAAVTTAFGISCGSLVLSTATVLGIAAILSQVANVMWVIRLLGAAYLAYLAYGCFRRAVNPPPLKLDSDVAFVSGRSAATTGFLMQLLNPKAIFFWLAIAAAGGVGDAPWQVVILFILGSQVNSFLGHGAYAVVLSSGGVRAAYAKGRRWIEAGLGGIFAVASASLAAGSR